MIELTTNTEEKDVETVEVFKIDGVPYSIPKQVDASVSLRYLKLAREQGEVIASGYLLERLLGEEGYEALANMKGLEQSQLDAVILACQAIVMGEVDPKGV